MNNKLKILIAVFLVLAIGLTVSMIVDSKSKKATFKSELIDIDTNSVSKIAIKSKAAPEGFELIKQDEKWFVKVKDKQFPADDRLIKGIVQQLDLVKTKRVASKSKDKWTEYEVSDSLGSFITIYEGNSVTADFIAGKFSFTQSQNPYQRQPDIHSYIRLAGENETYLTDGMFSMMFNRDANSFRNSTLVGCKKDDISRISFMYPADSSFVLEKADNKWKVNGTPADSAKTAQFVNDLCFRSIRNYSTQDSPVGNANYTITIEGTNMQAITLKAFAVNENEYMLTSSQNEGTTFALSKTDLIQMFKGGSFFKQN